MPENHDLAVLAEGLTECARFWQGSPFEPVDLPWRDSDPDLCERLDRLSDDAVGELRANHEAAVSWLGQYPAAQMLRELIATAPHLDPVGGAAAIGDRHLPHVFMGVPGRKEAQIRRFLDRVPDDSKDYLEWCSGKGHLARALVSTRSGSRATCLEIDAQLCAAGSRNAQFGSSRGAAIENLPIEFVQGDALDLSATEVVMADRQALALHACGDLHTTLLRRAVDRQVRSIVISPCCYHLSSEESVVPLSTSGRASGIVLTRDDLRMAVQETAVAGAGTKRRRQLEVSFRLGFDALQRKLRQTDQYLNVPNVPKALLSEGFPAFCRWAASLKGVDLSAKGVDFQRWEEIGRQRFEVVEKIELVRDSFRRPLEMWLVKDRAAFLTENDYSVQVGTFCGREITPRNLMIRARKL